MKQQKGFAFVELLVVVAILSVLLTIILVVLNPAKQFSQANNTKRISDVSALVNSIHQYATNHNGALPEGITSTAQTIRSSGANICSALVSTYLAALPADPSVNNGAPVTDCTVAGGYNTGYAVVKNETDKRVTVIAPSAELGQTISVTR